MEKIRCCGNCEYADYDDVDGYVCSNEESEYLSDFVEYDFCCAEHEQNQ